MEDKEGTSLQLQECESQRKVTAQASSPGRFTPPKAHSLWLTHTPLLQGLREGGKSCHLSARVTTTSTIARRALCVHMHTNTPSKSRKISGSSLEKSQARLPGNRERDYPRECSPFQCHMPTDTCSLCPGASPTSKTGGGICS